MEKVTMDIKTFKVSNETAPFFTHIDDKKVYFFLPSMRKQVLFIGLVEELKVTDLLEYITIYI